MLTECGLVGHFSHRSLTNQMQSGSNDNNQISKLLTPKDLALILNVSSTTIYRIIEGQQILFYKVGGSIRFRRTDIEDYLNKNRFEPLK